MPQEQQGPRPEELGEDPLAAEISFGLEDTTKGRGPEHVDTEFEWSNKAGKRTVDVGEVEELNWEEKNNSEQLPH